MGPSLGKTQSPSKRFLEDRRDFLFWICSSQNIGPQTPGYLINEAKEYILFGGDRIIVKPARS